MKKWIFASCMIVSLVFEVAIGGALANAPAFTLDNLTGASLGNPPFTLGWSFSTNSSITVTEVGIFDDSQNGLVDSYPVGIWNSSGTLLNSATVASGTTDPLINQFRYTAITPTLLAAGQTYFIGALYLDGNDPLIFPGAAVGFATDPSITFIQSEYAVGGSLSFPNLSVSTDPSYFGPNFLLTSTVPEPSTLLLLGSGLLGLVGLRWRRN
jgi:hypothetical protein